VLDEEGPPLPAVASRGRRVRRPAGRATSWPLRGRRQLASRPRRGRVHARGHDGHLHGVAPRPVLRSRGSSVPAR